MTTTLYVSFSNFTFNLLVQVMSTNLVVADVFTDLKNTQNGQFWKQ